ncbi:hypothetical protein GGR54DRAFT_176828 [Hypoxylon sp. NC1633]|nr:hypothetical protein GGR54DRAFT_176828 [Hypoxylon sp. NC1633]
MGVCSTICDFIALILCTIAYICFRLAFSSHSSPLHPASSASSASLIYFSSLASSTSLPSISYLFFQPLVLVILSYPISLSSLTHTSISDNLDYVACLPTCYLQVGSHISCTSLYPVQELCCT